MELKICKHGNGYGWCSLHKEYCPQSPCEYEELIIYAPVEHGIYESTLEKYRQKFKNRKVNEDAGNMEGHKQI